MICLNYFNDLLWILAQRSTQLFSRLFYSEVDTWWCVTVLHGFGDQTRLMLKKKTFLYKTINKEMLQICKNRNSESKFPIISKLRAASYYIM